MAIEWLAGNRLRGTTAERPNFGLPSGSVGGWVELGRTTLGSAGDDIDITSLPNKRYYHVLINPIPTGSINSNLHFNGSSSGYAQRHSVNGSGETALGNRQYWDVAGAETNPFFSSMYIANLSGKEKLGIQHSVEVTTAGAGTAPERAEYAQKWITTDVINRMNLNNLGTGSFNTGSEVVVLGWDPADTHTTNFWEELASVDSGAGEILDSGTFTAKKYLWYQFDIVVDQYNNTNATIRFNGDTGSNYANRKSQNGGADSTGASQNQMSWTVSGGRRIFGNHFVINNASNEKLDIGHHTIIGTASNSTSEGAGTAPRRIESVGKWANTSDQITKIQVLDSVQGDLGLTSGTIKVWGAD